MALQNYEGIQQSNHQPFPKKKKIQTHVYTITQKYKLIYSIHLVYTQYDYLPNKINISKPKSLLPKIYRFTPLYCLPYYIYIQQLQYIQFPPASITNTTQPLSRRQIQSNNIYNSSFQINRQTTNPTILYNVIDVYHVTLYTLYNYILYNLNTNLYRSLSNFDLGHIQNVDELFQYHTTLKTQLMLYSRQKYLYFTTILVKTQNYYQYYYCKYLYKHYNEFVFIMFCITNVKKSPYEDSLIITYQPRPLLLLPTQKIKRTRTFKNNLDVATRNINNLIPTILNNIFTHLIITEYIYLQQYPHLLQYIDIKLILFIQNFNINLEKIYAQFVHNSSLTIQRNIK
eukprot:TRINITY_DN17375_c0_g1_i6.p2 TRINITY_DN17375_c0_g1~~TRINITY_DN17375_c0_g1_i6.p2  ORF type:complete len:342 (+),score=-38.61 TRINITY_DN17375_c0_g1_i6:347-1372(+)